MQDERLFIDPMGRMYRIKHPEPLSDPPRNLRIARASKPWAIYLRMLGTVIPAFFLMYVLLFLVIGAIRLEPGLILVSGICSAPLVFLIFRLHKPRLVHVRLAVPDASGSEAHALPEGGSLRTPMKTKLTRFLVKDDSILDVPPNRQLWGLFAAVVSAGIAISILMLAVSEVGGVLLFLLLAVPIWFVGFSLPVLAWWGTSNKLLGLPTRRRDAEAWLMAGMASAFPAFIFNSLIAPELIPFEQEHWAFEFSLLAAGAPFCEEIFKAMAVVLFLPYITGPKHGFQVGFTVGLGFALIENFQYIGFSLLDGALSVSITILVRGIGSIPGHAIWTAITGTAIGWMATDKELKARLSWKARSLAISAIDMAEGIGIDTDGDGDLSGFDGPRPTLEEAISKASLDEMDESNPWFILGGDMEEGDAETGTILGTDDFDLIYEKESVSRKSRGIQTPKGISSAIALSIAGHSFWNGSSFLSFYAPKWLGMGDAGATLIMLSWVIFLICSVLLVARGLIRGVNSLE